MTDVELRERINKILDMVSSAYPEDTREPNSPMVRWGHDTNCGNNDEIVDKAIKILLE